ncbi:MAG: hypothetical protein ACOYLI_12345 [Synechococcus lacustris]
MAPTWVNSPVLMEALLRYEQGRLPQQMRHWLRAVLGLDDDCGSSSLDLLPSQSQGGHKGSGH